VKGCAKRGEGEEKQTRRLGELVDTGDEHDSEDDLESDREPPVDGSVNVGETEIDPVGDGST
jgi:hypothetical protein